MSKRITPFASQSGEIMDFKTTLSYWHKKNLVSKPQIIFARLNKTLPVE